MLDRYTVKYFYRHLYPPLEFETVTLQVPKHFGRRPDQSQLNSFTVNYVRRNLNQAGGEVLVDGLTPADGPMFMIFQDELDLAEVVPPMNVWPPTVQSFIIDASNIRYLILSVRTQLFGRVYDCPTRRVSL